MEELLPEELLDVLHVAGRSTPRRRVAWVSLRPPSRCALDGRLWLVSW
jgi:hypothetical protein